MTFEEWRNGLDAEDFYDKEMLLRKAWTDAVKDERKACAELCDAQHFGGDHDDDLAWTGCAAVLAEEIRTRSNVGAERQ